MKKKKKKKNTHTFTYKQHVPEKYNNMNHMDLVHSIFLFLFDWKMGI